MITPIGDKMFNPGTMKQVHNVCKDEVIDILKDVLMCEARRGDNSWVACWAFIYSRPVRGMPGA